MRIGSAEHYGWTDWYAVSVRHVFSAADTGGSSYAWVEGPRGPRGEALSLLVTARTPPRGWREPAAGQRLDVWSWPVAADEAASWTAALSEGRSPVWSDPGSPHQWLTVRGDDTGPPAAHPLERARMFRGLTFRGRTTGADLAPGTEGSSAAGVATSADLRVATRNFERTSVWCVVGDEGRVVDDPPGLPAMREVFFLPGTRFRCLGSWHEQVEDIELDVVLVHQLDTVRGPDAPPLLEPSRARDAVRILIARAAAEPPLRLRDPGRFLGPLTDTTDPR